MTLHGDVQTGLNLDPFMIHEVFLCLTETAFGSHPCRVVSVTYRKLRPFHGGSHRRIAIGRGLLSKTNTRRAKLTGSLTGSWPFLL